MTPAPDATPGAAAELLRLHRDPTLLTVVNVWDAISAKVVAETPGTAALATASHSIAASHGYEDGEQIPVETMIEACGRIVAATTLPVTADLEAGYGDPGETVRRAIAVGVVGCNLEDQVQPLEEFLGHVETVIDTAVAEGVPDFVLNARTDVLLRAGDRDRDVVISEAAVRARAFVEAGAPVVFVPGKVTEDEVARLVDAVGPQRLTLIGVPGNPPLARLEELGVARVSYGPYSQRVALTALQQLVEAVHAGGGLPDDVRPLN